MNGGKTIKKKLFREHSNEWRLESIELFFRVIAINFKYSDFLKYCEWISSVYLNDHLESKGSLHLIIIQLNIKS